MKNISTIVKFAIAILGVIFCIMIIIGVDGTTLNGTGNAGLNGATWLAIIAMLVGTAAAVLFGIGNLVSKGAQAKGTLLGIVGFAVVALGCYLLASDGIPAGINPATITAGTSKMVSAGINLFLVLLGGALVAIVLGEVRSLLS